MFLAESQQGIWITNSPNKGSATEDTSSSQVVPINTQDRPSNSKSPQPTTPRKQGSILKNSNARVPLLPLQRMDTPTPSSQEFRVRIFLTPDQKFIRYEKSHPSVEVVTMVESNPHHVGSEGISTSTSTMPTPRMIDSAIPLSMSYETKAVRRPPSKNVVTIQTRKLGLHDTPDTVRRSYADRGRSVSIEKVVAVSDTAARSVPTLRQTNLQEVRECLITSPEEFFARFETEDIDLSTDGWASFDSADEGKTIIIGGPTGLLAIRHDGLGYRKQTTATAGVRDLKCIRNRVVAITSRDWDLLAFRTPELTPGPKIAASWKQPGSQPVVSSTLGCSSCGEFAVWIISPKDICVIDLVEMKVCENIALFWEKPPETTQASSLQSRSTSPVNNPSVRTTLLLPFAICASRDANVIMGVGKSQEGVFYLVYYQAKTPTGVKTKYHRLDEIVKDSVKQVGSLEISRDGETFFLTCILNDRSSKCFSIGASSLPSLRCAYQFAHLKNQLASFVHRVPGHDILLCSGLGTIECIQYQGTRFKKVFVLSDLFQTPIQQMLMRGNTLYVLSAGYHKLKALKFGGNPQLAIETAKIHSEAKNKFSHFSCVQIFIQSAISAEKLLANIGLKLFAVAGKSGTSIFKWDQLAERYAEIDTDFAQKLYMESGRITTSGHIVYNQANSNDLVVSTIGGTEQLRFKSTAQIDSSRSGDQYR